MSTKNGTAKRGAWTPKKSDFDAFSNGILTPHAARIERIVNHAFEAHRKYVRAKRLYEERLEKLFSRVNPAGNAVRVVSVDGKKQVSWSQRRIVKGNLNAEEAAALIQEVTGELLERTAASDDEKALAVFLGGVIQRTKGRIVMNANLVAFSRLQFSDPRLVKAQRLLKDAFDVTEGKVYARFEVYNEEKKGFGRAAWDDEDGQWYGE